MVGRLHDIVTAAVVVGATEKVNMSRTRNSSSVQPSSQSDGMQPNAASGNSGRFVVNTQGMQAEDDSLFQKDEKQQSEFHLEPGTLDEETVDLMTQELNDLMSKIDCNLQFNYHQDAGVMSVKMIDKETQEVIKELPPEEMVENLMKAKIWLGAFIDKTI